MIVPIVGVVGIGVGCALTIALADATETQLDEFVTINVCVCPAVKPEIVPVVPVPVALPEGEPVTVQEPDAGKPLNATLPVAVEQVGWVIVPIVGVVGVVGCALTTALADATEVHVPLLTVNA